MDQWAKTLAAKPDYPKSMPGTHRWKERTNSSLKLSSVLHTRCMHMPLSHTQTNKQMSFLKIKLKIKKKEA